MNQMLMNAKYDGGDQVDALLSRHFKSEMPDPWPECEAIVQARREPRRKKLRTLGRFALAASVVLFFLGYLTLAGIFPRQTAKPQEGGTELGSKSGLNHQVQPKR